MSLCERERIQTFNRPDITMMLYPAELTISFNYDFAIKLKKQKTS